MNSQNNPNTHSPSAEEASPSASFLSGQVAGATTDLAQIATLNDFQNQAQRELPDNVFEYYLGGSGQERTLQANERDWAKIMLAQRVGIDVRNIDTSVETIGGTSSQPFFIPPMGFQGATQGSDVDMARAAANKGIVYITSTASTDSLEQITAVRGETPQWFQLYVTKDRGLSNSLVQRAQDAGYRALVITMDTPFVGRRPRSIRKPLEFSGDILGNFRGMNVPGGDMLQYFSEQIDPSITWEDIEGFARQTSLPVIMKGPMHADDLSRAMEIEGVDGVIISNHGGRQLDSGQSTVNAAQRMQEVISGIPNDFHVMMDGGIRDGHDVVKGCALGSRMVGIGRPFIYALAVDGQRGVEHALDIVSTETRFAMAQCGVTDVSSITKDVFVL